MQSDALTEWLERIKNQHRMTIDLGLDRVKKVASELNLLNPDYRVLTVAGTNGKGSTVAGLEAIYLAAGYRVGAFTSPYLYRFNELVRVQGSEVGDEDFIQAFQQIERARGQLTLTQFEFNTLAAFIIFQQAKIEIAILEVGLGGRLDAVNILDTDLAVVTSIAIDHAEWLGNTREEIAREKAGIFRTDKPAVSGDLDTPNTLRQYANDIHAPLFCQGEQFGFEAMASSWNWWNETKRFENLPLTPLALQNMSSVLMAVDLMQERLPVKREAIENALLKVNLPGRIQVCSGAVTTIFDVSHNPAAAEFLARYLQKNAITGKTRAAFSMLADKDILSTIDVMKDCVDEWYIAALPVERGASLDVLEYCFRTVKIDAVCSYGSIEEAYRAAVADSINEDRVVVFGSFYTVGGIAHGDLL
ncbi:MAG: bifunctional tetrahydrofolate synthase/dihydrofolate synthase [Gammaproteobacteria bacterium]